MNQQRIRAVIAKDLTEVLSNRMAVVPMIVVPIIMAVLLPLGLTLTAFLAPTTQISSSSLMTQLVDRYPVPQRFSTLPDSYIYIFLNYLFIPLLLIIPIMVSIVIAANAVTGEKERHTLETLLSTPLSRQEFLCAKVLAAFVPAWIVAVVAFGLYFASANTVSWIFRQSWMVDSVLWWPVILLVSPAVSLLGLAITLMVSLKARSFMEAQQASALIVLPLVAVVVGQISGLVVLSPFWLVVGALVIFSIDAVLIFRVAPRFDREKVLNTL